MNKTISTRISQKHDFESVWASSNTFVPLAGELIIYDAEVDDQGNLLTELPEGRTEPYTYSRMKIGDGVTSVGLLPFVGDFTTVPSTRVTHEENLLSDVLDTYVLNIDYETLLAFDTSEIISGGTTNTTSVLGQAILGQLVLA